MNGHVIVRFDGTKTTIQLEFMSCWIWQNFFDFFVLKHELLGNI